MPQEKENENGGRGVTWRIVAVSAASVVVLMAAAWAVDVRVSINQIRSQNNEILAQQSTIQSQQAILTSLYNDLSARVLRLENFNLDNKQKGKS